MIVSLNGLLREKNAQLLVIEAGGVGYEVSITPTTSSALPPVGEAAYVLICESFGMYGSGQSLYGFASPSEKELFEIFRGAVPSTGAKKALEYLEKASKSLPDFRRAILESDHKMLLAVFGFTKKTADKLIAALKDKIQPGPQDYALQKIKRANDSASSQSSLSQVMNGLAALGYKPSEAKLAVAAVIEETNGSEVDVEKLLRMALKKL